MTERAAGTKAAVKPITAAGAALRRRRARAAGGSHTPGTAVSRPVEPQPLPHESGRRQSVSQRQTTSCPAELSLSVGVRLQRRAGHRGSRKFHPSDFKDTFHGAPAWQRMPHTQVYMHE